MLDLTTVDKRANDSLAAAMEARNVPHPFARGIDANLCKHCGLGPSIPNHQELTTSDSEETA